MLSSFEKIGDHKFTKKIYPCVFIGYSPLHKGYRCLDPITHNIYISCHVVFNEHVFPFGPTKKPLFNNVQDSLHLTKFLDADEWLQAPMTSNKGRPNDQTNEHLIASKMYYMQFIEEATSLIENHFLMPQTQGENPSPSSMSSLKEPTLFSPSPHEFESFSNSSNTPNISSHLFVDLPISNNLEISTIQSHVNPMLT